jgi:hypothetical protein
MYYRRWPCTSSHDFVLPLNLHLEVFLPTILVHFFPFFFFFPAPLPPPVPGFCSAGTPPIFTSSSTFGVDTPVASAVLRSSATSGSAAICLPSRPKLPISLPTSAALAVSYCKHVPDAGSYVLRVNVAVGSSGFCGGGGGDEERDGSAGLALFLSRYFCRFLILDAVGFRTVYLEVKRV